MRNDEMKELCLSLMRADSEVDVIAILKKAGYWDDPTVWRLYGDIENNYSTAGNQADEADAAIVEKLTNSRDAILLDECLKRGIDPEGPEAPKSIKEAMAIFFDNNSDSEFAGSLSHMDKSQRREIAERLSVYLTGNKPSAGFPSLNIADTGEGQTPYRIPETILSLGKSIKMRIPFVHGKFNMGGTAALSYCGTRNLQLVISRRDPSLIEKPENPNDDHWGFTIVRREFPEGNRDTSIYTFLAPIQLNNSNANQPKKSQILSFAAEELSIFAVHNEPYKRSVKWGTLIKLYECKVSRQQLRGKGGLMRPLDLLAPDLGFPFRLHECRYPFDEKSTTHQMNGLKVRLFDQRKQKLHFDPVTIPFKVPFNGIMHELKAAIYAFKEPAITYRDSDKAVVFTLNGQSQGWLPESFFTRTNVGLSFLKSRLLVMVDCDGLSTTAQEEFFMPSRDRLRKGPFRKEIESTVEKILKSHQGLEDFQEELQRKFSNDKIDDSKPLENILSDIFKHSISLSKIFLKGEKLTSAFKSINVQKEPQKKYEGREYPTFFKFREIDYGLVLKKSAHIGSTCKIFFSTDMENDYFGRKYNQGTYRLLLKEYETDQSIENHNFIFFLNPFNGIATLNIELTKKDLVIGQKLLFELQVTDPLRIIEGPFVNQFELTLQPPLKESSGGNGKRINPPSNVPGDGQLKASGISFPEIKKVREKDWPDLEMNAFSALKAVKKKTENGESQFRFYVNMDNLYLRNEIKGNPNNESVFNGYFEFGMALVALGVIYEETKDSKDKQLEGIEDKIEISTRSMAPFLIPMINELPKLNPKYEEAYI